MTNAEKIAVIARIIAADPKQAKFGSDMIAALAKGKTSPAQEAAIGRMIARAENPMPSLRLTALADAFRNAAASVKFPKVVVVADGIEWTLSRVSETSDKANPANRGTVSIASGKYGDPAAKWGGRILADGTVNWGKDATPALADALTALPTESLPLKRSTRRAPSPDRSEREMSPAWQEEQHSARHEDRYGTGYDPNDD